jgi:S1-C subfamily serine protease
MMDIKDLNKTQVVMLCLLCSFVTSIATGIVTVSLMDQAPLGVTNTINRIVERTVEKVTTPTIIGGKNTVKETTVVVKDEDLVTKSIESMKNSVVAVRSRAIGTDGVVTNTFLGWGTVLSSDGLILTDASILGGGVNFGIQTEDGKIFDVKVARVNENTDVALLALDKNAIKDNKDLANYVFVPAKIADTNNLQLGQNLVAFGGRGSKKAITIGVISSLALSDIKGESASSTPKKRVVSIDATVVPSLGITGGPLINSFGEVVGFSTLSGLGDRVASYVPISYAKDEQAFIK